MTPQVLQLVAQSLILGIPLTLLIVSGQVRRGAFPFTTARLLSSVLGGMFALAMSIYLSGLGLSMTARLIVVLLSVGVFSWANAVSLRSKAASA